MKFIVIVFVLNFISVVCYANNKAESHSSKIVKNSRDSIHLAKVKLFFDSGYELYKQNKPEVSNYCDSIKQYSENNNFELGLAYYYELLALSLKNQQKYLESNENLYKALAIYTKFNNIEKSAQVHNLLGILYKLLYLYDQSISHYFEAIKLYESINSSDNTGRAYYNISNIYIRIKSYDKAKDILQKSLVLFDSTGNKVGSGLSYFNLSKIYFEDKDYNRAWELLQKANMLFTQAKYNIGKIIVGDGIANIFKERGQIKKASVYYYNAYNSVKNTNLFNITIEVAAHYASTLIQMNKLDSAISFLDQIDTTLYKSKNFEELKSLFDAYSEAYKKLGKDHAALKYYQLSATMRDSLYNLDMLNKLSNVDIIFSIYEKNKYIKSLEQERQIDELKLKQKEQDLRLIIIMAVSAFILLILIIVFFYLNHRKNKERLLLKEQVIATENKLQLILAGTDQGIYGVDLEGNCTFINDAACKIIGYNSDECIGNQMHNLIHKYRPDGSTYALQDCIFNKRADTSFKIDGELLFRKDGSSFMAAISSNPMIKDGQRVGAVISFIDITERLKTQERVEESERNYRLLANNSDDVIWTMDNNLKLTYISPSVYNLRGFTPDEVMLQKITDVASPRTIHILYNGLAKNIEEIKTGVKGASSLMEYEQFKKDGTTIWTESLSKVMYDTDNKPIGIVGITRNIEDRIKSLEEKSRLLEELYSSNEQLEINMFQKNSIIEELSESKAALEKTNQEKDKFFSIIAHDLKSPFSGFLGLTAIFANDIEVFTLDELKELGKSLQESASNLYKLLDNLLQWSRIQRSIIETNPEEVSLHLLVEQNIKIQSEVARNKEIVIKNNLDINTNIHVDVSMMNTVFRNLLSNSLKFTPRGGSIEIGSKFKDNSTILIHVKDSGIGMPTKIKDNLFKIDEKVSRPGTEDEPSTGLGLLLCKEFVEKNKGIIWVESEEGHGSTFFIQLPIKVVE
ncbi:MAG TPA: PAS domain S-box protein [Candidatus Kapabacteria bacterium]|nr:PAS domain S-box protein [Candidatus Kapabacteria bacterium]